MMNDLAEYLGQSLSRSTVIVRTQTHTADRLQHVVHKRGRRSYWPRYVWECDEERVWRAAR